MRSLPRHAHVSTLLKPAHRNAQTRQPAVCVAEIDIVEAGTAQKQNPDAHLRKQIDHRSIHVVVDEYADRITALRQRGGVLVQPGLKKFEPDAVRFPLRFKGGAVVGLGIIKCNLHGSILIFCISGFYYTPKAGFCLLDLQHNP